MNITIPRDYSSYTEFRKLEAILEKRFPSANIMAHFLYVRWWVELAYQAAICPIGCQPKEEFPYFYEKLRISTTGIDEALLLEIFKTAGMIKEEGNYYYSLTFFEFNQELSRNYKLQAVKAAEIINLQRRRNLFSKLARTWIPNIPPEFFNEVDGQTVTEQEMNQIVVLIMTIDSIFARPQRSKQDLGVGVIQDGCRMIRRFGAIKVEAIIARLLSKQRLPGLPKTAEEFLANLDLYLLKLEPDDGWGVWASFLTKK